MRSTRTANLLAGLIVGSLLTLSGCSSVGHIVQGSIDQFAAADRQATREVTRFQVPEDALQLRDRQLEQAMIALGGKIARGYTPRVRLTVLVGRSADAGWLLGAIDKGITATGWPREAVMVAPQIRLTNQYPMIIVEEGVKS